MRFALALVVAAAIAGIAVPNASAIRFADAPCPEASAGGARVCPTALVGSFYAVKLDGEGGCGPDPNVPGSGLPYQYRLLNGQLPPGLSLRKDGLISGVPTQTGSWSFWVELSDEDPPSASWCRPSKSEREFTVAVGVPPAEVGVPYALALGPGDTPQTWSIASGQLPAGLALDSARGAITGTPEISGSFSLQLSVVDGAGQTRLLAFVINVSPRLAFVTTRLPLARVGRPYGVAVRLTGGVGPVTLRVVSGRFPPGVRLLATGRVAGKPLKAGLYRVTMEVRDALGVSASSTFVLTVRRALRARSTSR